jgi:hypothetical protein
MGADTFPTSLIVHFVVFTLHTVVPVTAMNTKVSRSERYALADDFETGLLS